MAQQRWRPQEHAFDHGEERLVVRYRALGDEHFEVAVVRPDEDEPMWRVVRGIEARGAGLLAEIDGVRRRFHVGEGTANRLAVHGLGGLSELTRVPRFPERRASSVAGGCAAPMTGRVVEVAVAEGDHVEVGSTLVVLEAMKMEHRLKAQEDGVVKEVHAQAGQMVDPDEVLVVVGSVEDTESA